MLMFVLLLSFIAFAISAGIEYWVVSSSDTLGRWYTSDRKADKIKAMIVSILISVFFGTVVGGAGAGGGVYTGMVILFSTGAGFATNTMTYNFFLNAGKLIRLIKRGFFSIEGFMARWDQIKQNRYYEDIKLTWTGGVKVAAVLIMIPFFVLGLPGFIYRKASQWRSYVPFRRAA